MRFIHCADIHLDSPLRGLERYEGAPVEEVRGATRRAFENMVQCALREKVDFVVIAGDLYDGDWPDFNTGLFFAKAMAELGESGIAVYVIRGNHDAASKLTRSLPLPKNVHLFPDKAPGTQTDDNLGLAVHGQSFATAAVLDDLAVNYPQALPGYFNLGVLHTSLTGRPENPGRANGSGVRSNARSTLKTSGLAVLYRFSPRSAIRPPSSDFSVRSGVS